jgi:hypothetical protein
MANDLSRAELEGAVRVIESIRGRDFNALAAEIKQRAQALETQLWPCYSAFLEASNAGSSRLNLLRDRIQPRVASDDHALSLYMNCIRLGTETLEIDLSVAKAIGEVYLPLQTWIGSGSGQLAALIERTRSDAGRDATISFLGFIPFPPVSTVASAASLSLAIRTLSQASAKVDDVFAALQATAGALWSLEVLESTGVKQCAALLDDAKKAIDLSGVAITELEETARSVAL